MTGDGRRRVIWRGVILALLALGLACTPAPTAPSVASNEPRAAASSSSATPPASGPVPSPSPVAGSAASPAAKPAGAPSPAAVASPAALATEGCAGGPYAEVVGLTAPRVTLEIADDDAERSRGLMFRESLPQDQGMLFVFPRTTRGGFWMRNTLIPLSIAFILEDGTILDIQDMQPLDESPHAPPGAYRFALEMNQGWYAANNVKAGDRFRFCAGQ